MGDEVNGSELAADSAWTAAACWLGGLFTGPVVPGVVLVMSWRARGSLVRRHALAATVMWSALLAVYLPVFLFAMFLPALHGDPPPWWSLAVAGAVVVISWTGTATGLILAWRAGRREAAVSDARV
jgi:hypothetical protein